MEDVIDFLKVRLWEIGEKWKSTGDVEYMKHCLAIVKSINVLEQHEYGKIITVIEDIL